MTAEAGQLPQSVRRWLLKADLPAVLLEYDGSDCLIRFCTEAWAELAGESRESLEGKRLQDFYRLNSDDLLQRLLPEKGPETDTLALTLQHSREDRETRWNELWLTRLPGNRTNPVLLGVQRDITQQRWDQARLELKAGMDSLTGLFNREQFLHEVKQRLSKLKVSRSGAAVVFLDLDNFKPINDNYGHAVGDLLLQQLGKRLRAAVRSSDLVARFGGDEFVLAFFGVTGSEQAREMTERLFSNLFAPFTLPDGQAYQLNASAGVAFTADSEVNPEELIDSADAAMYKAKGAGKQQVAIGTALKTGATHLARGHFEEALVNEDIELFFQPVLSLPEKLTIGFEVLPYWHHPERGLLSHDHFQEFIDNSAAGQAFNRWLINEVAQLSAKFKRDGYDIGMGINMMPAQIESGSFVDTLQEVRRYFDDGQVDLTLEIVETIQFQDNDLAFSALEHAREMGCQVVLDDFGTGLSSITFASRLPLDFIKLHASAVHSLDRKPERQRLATAIIQFAHALGYRVLASGVRRQAESELLEKLGCDMIQGGLLNQPLSLEHVRRKYLDPKGSPPHPLRRFDL